MNIRSKIFSLSLCMVVFSGLSVAQPSSEAVLQMRAVGKNHVTVSEILDKVSIEIEQNKPGFASGYVSAILNTNDWKDNPDFCIPKSSMRDIFNRVIVGLYELEVSERGTYSAALAIPIVLQNAYPCK